MGARERRKGISAELEVVSLARAHGLQAIRTWRFAQSLFPAKRAIDVRIAGRNFQVKRRRAGFRTLYRNLEHVHGLFLRDDDQNWLAVIRAEDFLRLLAQVSKVVEVKKGDCDETHIRVA